MTGAEIDKENIFKSFSMPISTKQASSTKAKDAVSLPNHGIGDGIGDIEGLDENQSKCDDKAHSDPSPEFLDDGPPQDG